MLKELRTINIIAVSPNYHDLKTKADNDTMVRPMGVAMSFALVGCGNPGELL